MRARFEAEVLPHLDDAYRFARWLSRSSGEAEDVVQEAMLRAFRAYGSLRSANPKSWLLTIVKNCHLRAAQLRGRQAHVPLSVEIEPQESPGAQADLTAPEVDSLRRDEQRLLERFLSGLSEEHREVLVLREIEDLDYRAIATITNVPIGTVMSRLARARAALKALGEQDLMGDARAVL